MQRQPNSFDGIRLLAALLVVFGHAWVLWSVSAEIPTVLGVRLEALGLAVFFALSGYLVTQSWDRCRSPWVFLWHRSLRIFPALWVTVALTALLVGPVVSLVTVDGLHWWTGLANYFGTLQPLTYLSGLLLMPQYELAGVLPYSSSVVNGSLWTIGIEFICYFVVLAIGVAVARYRVALMLLMGASLAVVDGASREIELLQPFQDAARVMVYFTLGACLTAMPRRVMAHGWLVPSTLLMWATCAFMAPGLTQIWAWLAIPMLTVALGQRSIPGLRSAARYGDLTYGIYLWSFPVLQLFLWVPVAMPFAVRLIVAVLLSASLAYLSWHAIEKRALELKSWRPPTRAAIQAPGSPLPRLTWRPRQESNLRPRD